MAIPEWHPIGIAVIKHGDRMIWQCDECNEEGVGAEAMNDHLIRTGHEWFENLGNAHRKRP